MLQATTIAGIEGTTNEIINFFGGKDTDLGSGKFEKRLKAFRKDIKSGYYEQYIWSTDPNKLEEGNAKFYWVESGTPQYKIYAIKKVDRAIKLVSEGKIDKLFDENL